MSENPSRQTSAEDRWSTDAKSSKEHWLCECGLARISATKMFGHCNTEGHMAEKIDTDTGEVIGFMAGGMSDQKYGTQIPSNANIKREANKNDPLFERP